VKETNLQLLSSFNIFLLFNSTLCITIGEKRHYLSKKYYSCSSFVFDYQLTFIELNMHMLIMTILFYLCKLYVCFLVDWNMVKIMSLVWNLVLFASKYFTFSPIFTKLIIFCFKSTILAIVGKSALCSFLYWFPYLTSEMGFTCIFGPGWVFHFAAFYMGYVE